MKIKLYRHTIKHTEYLGDGRPEHTYYTQTEWHSIKDYLPIPDMQEVVKVEVKEVEFREACPPCAKSSGKSCGKDWCAYKGDV